MDSQNIIQEIITRIQTAVSERSVTNTMEARVMQWLLDYVLSLGDMLSSEKDARMAADASLNAEVVSTRNSLLALMAGNGSSASAGLYPFLNLGNVASQAEVNNVLDGIYASTDLKYNGRLRLTRNGALITVTQHVVNAAEGFWAQCVAGMLAPSQDGASLVQAGGYGICVRYKDWSGTDSGWKLYGGAGDMRLKTVNGQSLVGEGDIEITAEGQIVIDDVVSGTSANAVSSRAVAAALEELVSGLSLNNTVDISQLDTLTGNTLAQDGKRSHYVVTAPYRGGTVIVGVLMMLSDDSRHSNTQVLVTHRLLDSGGTISEMHNDASLGVYWRSYGLQGNTYVQYEWSPWQRLVPDVSALSERLAQIEAMTGNPGSYDENLGTLEARISTLESSSPGPGPSPGQQTYTDGETIGVERVGGRDVMGLADVTRKETHGGVAVTVRTQGTTHVKTDTMPADEGDTKYLLYRDITSGNDIVEGASVIQLQPGSKLVPNGGIPKVPVLGGEISWVHSSDIGMIQDDTSLSNADRMARGLVNKQVMKWLIQSRYNLILDGDYLITSEHDSSKGDWFEVDEGEEILVERPLEIQGGGLYSTNCLMVIGEGGSLRAKGTTFGHVNFGGRFSGQYMLFGLDVYGCLIGHVIFEDCRFTGGARYIRSRSLNIRCSSSDTTVYKQWRNTQSVFEVLGLDPAVHASTTGQNERAIYYMPEGVATTTNDATNLQNALYAGGYGMDIYVPIPAGRSLIAGSKAFVMVTAEAPGTNSPNGTMDKADFDGGLVKYGVDSGGNPVWCRFKEVTVGAADDPGAPYYEPVPVDGAVAEQGVGTFILKGCRFEGYTGIMINDLMVRDVFRIESCHFTEMRSAGFVFSATNYLECGTEWNYRSCPLYVIDNVFEGPCEVQDGSNTVYRCAILYEGTEIHFKRNTVKNIAGNYKEIYDTYLTAQRVYYEDNNIRNVFKVPVPYGSDNYFLGPASFEWGKSKQCNGTKDWWTARDSGDTSALTERVYRRNSFVNDTDEAWLMAKPYMLSKYMGIVSGETEEEKVAAVFGLFKDYALRTILCAYVARNTYKRVVWEDNTIAMPDGLLRGLQASSSGNIAEEFTFRRNRLVFGRYMSLANNTAADAYNSFIFSVMPAFKIIQAEVHENYVKEKDGQGNETGNWVVGGYVTTEEVEPLTDIRIEDNSFEGGDGSVMQLLCQRGVGKYQGYKPSPTAASVYHLQPYLAKSITIKGNSFDNCAFRCNAQTSSQGETQSYNGDLRAERIDISKNSVRLLDIANADVPNARYGQAAGAYPGSKGTNTAPVVTTTLVCDSLYLYASKEVTAEIQDGQTVTAPCARTLKAHLADDKMRLRVVSPRMIRPVTVEDGAIVNTEQSPDLSLKIPVYLARPSDTIGTGAATDLLKAIRLRATFTMGGVRRTRIVEAQRTNNGGSTTRGWSVRDADGIRHGGTAAIWQKALTLAPEAGLLVHVRCAAPTYKKAGCLIEFSLYTPATGTVNDPGTDIEIEVTMLGGVEYINFSTGRITSGSTVTPIEAFVPKGTPVSTAWLNAKNDYDSATGEQGAILSRADAGYWCLDETTRQTMLWSGTAWTQPDTLPASTIWTGTQAQYDALSASQKANIIAFITEEQSTEDQSTEDQQE